MEVKAKKSLGQNFLKDETVLQRIVENANLSKNDVVVEIGPGTGLLTEKLAEKCKKVIAIELDDRLVPVLQEKFKGANVEIIHGDILKLHLPELLERCHSGLDPESRGMLKPQLHEQRGRQVQYDSKKRIIYKVVANIPYYITAPIIRLLLETKYPPQEMILMVQKEVAERIAAKPSEMSILAVSVQYYAKAEILFEVSRNSFDPVPEVDSAIIRIRNQESGIRNQDEAKKFFRLVKAGFSAKRKTLVNNLSNGLQLHKNVIEEKLGSLGFPSNTRAQELGVEDWKKLVQALE